MIGLAEAVNADEYLVHRGRWVTVMVMISVGPIDYLLDIDHGRVAEVRTGPFVTPSYGFSLAASAEEWEHFWAAEPLPGHHDLFAMFRRNALRVGGDTHIFMANLRYFKDVLAKQRAVAA